MSYNAYQNSGVPYQPYSDKAPLTGAYGAHEISQEPPPYSYAPNDQKFPEQKNSGFRDLLFAILFIVHLIAMVTLWGVGLARSSKGKGIENNEDWVPSMGSEFQRVLTICIVCIIVGGLTAFAWLVVIRKFARQLIISTLIASVIFWLIVGVFMLIRGILIGGVITLLIAGFHGLLYYWWRPRIPFATAMLTTIATRLQEYPATAYIAYASLFVQFVWILFWIHTVVLSQNFAASDTMANVYGVFLILSFYWTAQVIKNTVHVTSSGLFASWYFLHDQMPHNPTLKSLKRACTSSFGSICLGSLLVAALKTLRAIIRSIRNERMGIVVFLLDCIVGILDSLLRYFNMYAFTQVAIYGKSYCKAAKDTWNLIKSHGVEAIINDNLISGVLVLGSFLGGIICAIVAAIMALSTIEDYWITCAVLGFLIGFAMVMLTMEVVESGVATIFVCFAMDPLALKRNDPHLYQKFVETYSNYVNFV